MLRTLALVALAAACGDNEPGTPVTLVSGDATLQLAGNRSTLTFARAGATLLVFDADTFQAGTVDDLDAGDSFDPYDLFVDNPPAAPNGLAWHHGNAFALEQASDRELVVAVDALRVTFQPSAVPGGFDAVLTSTAARTAYLRLGPDASGSEGFYGLGEWADSIEHRGKLRPMQMELDQTSESMDDENHVPVPLLVGTNGWGLFVASKRPGSFGVATESATRVDVTFGTGADSPDGLAFHLFAADQALDVFAQYYAIAGAPGLPAPWALGPLLWRDGNTNQAQVIDDISQVRTRHLATNGMWFDHPYATGVETFDFDPAKFPDPPTMLQALHDGGLRYGVWQAAYAAPASNGDPAQPELDYATAHGYFPPTTAVLLNPWGKPIDFTNPDAYAWWQSQLATYTNSFGVEGFKLDYNEDVVVGLLGRRTPWAFADGSDELTMHYGYQLLYHQIHRELLPAAGGFLLTRTGRWGDQVHGMIIWPGDLDASFAQQGDPLSGGSTLAVGGLPAALAKGISLSASGFPFYASDTGGYRHAPANKECWVRWVEANSVWPAMQVGDASSEMPWEFTADNGRDAEALVDYAQYALLHLRLYPYVWSYALEIATSGRPIVRPLGLAHPELGVHPKDEYMLGDWIVSAPVVAAGETSRQVVLPPGTWIGWWDGQSYSGTITAPADLDTLPLYLAEGGIVPMLRDTIDTLAPVAAGSQAAIDSFATDPGVLWVRVAPGAAATQLAVYDGTQLAQQAGTVSYMPGTVYTEGALFEVIATPTAPTQVTANGTALAQQASLAALKAAGTGWFHDPSATGATLWIEVAGAASVTYQ
ncbi:MAG TPA: TIM-barrel domain-containing protein [Kofleriaceae bacterium]|nr:TIM-barrel domain-containing protein [Kofleriaceae bacterium]